MEELVTPPGTGTWKVEAGAGQLPLENIVCVWNMGANYSDESYQVAILNSTTPHEITFSYGEDDVGNQTITVNCSNAVSDQILTMDVEVNVPQTPSPPVAAVAVTLGGLSCDNPAMKNEAVTCRLNITDFGTGTCFEWDMGDGQPSVYLRDGDCAVDIPGSPVYLEVELNVLLLKQFVSDLRLIPMF